VLLTDDLQGSAAVEAADTPASVSAERPVRLAVPDDVLDGLRARLRSTRWLELPGAGSWRWGANVEYLQELVAYWADAYDWRSRERRLNTLPNRVARVGADTVHFLHARSPEREALPLLIVHGWPTGPFEFADVLERLTHPTRHGARSEDAFHVVVVSMPGFLLSGSPRSASYDVRDAAETVRTLMMLLGYERYGTHGGDWGAMVAAWLGHLVPEQLVGLHLTTVVAPRDVSAELSAEERSDLRAQERFRGEEMAYQALQATKPDALAMALGDSPAGLAAWLVDKYRSWSDCGGDVESVFDRNLLLDLCTLYWSTGTIGASMRLYFNTRVSGRVPLAAGPITVPTGCAIFARDLTRPPRSWAEHAYRVERWSAFPRGGHFPALEQPGELVEDLRAFFRPFR
jgi:pimeloyl-ACP methyl ester carboxylesterase